MSNGSYEIVRIVWVHFPSEIVRVLNGIEGKVDPAELDFFLDSPAIRFLEVERWKRREWVQQYFESRSKNGDSGKSYEELRRNDE